MPNLICTTALVSIDTEAINQMFETAASVIEPTLNQAIAVLNAIFQAAADNPVIAVAVIAVGAWAILTAID